MRLAIRYVTRFLYEGPVWQSHNTLRACPMDGDNQRVLEYRVTTTPVARVYSYLDYWGTRVDAFGVRPPHPRLEIVAEAVVETRAPRMPQWASDLANASDGDGICVAELDPARVDAARRQLPVLQHRRPEVYGLGAGVQLSV